MADNSDNLATLAQNIKQGVENRLKDLHTAMPGIIQSFNSEEQTVTVQPAIKRIFKTLQNDIEILVPSDLPILINVPINYPRGGGYSLTFPISQGDECLLVFSERSIDNWHINGGVKRPLAKRFHSLSDATAIVGLSSIPNKIPNYNSSDAQLKKDNGECSLSLKSDNGIRLENSSGYVELLADGRFDINGIVFEEHVHPQANDSEGDTEQDTGVPQ